MKRLAILSTHPIQYNAPLYRLLAADTQTEVMVFFSKATEATRFDQDFGKEVVWDIPLTTGYSSRTIPSDRKSGALELIAQIETWKPDALLVYGWSPPGHLSIMRHFKEKVPVWFRGDSTIQSGRKDWKRTFRRIYLRWVYRHVDIAFYVGTLNKAYFLWAGLSEQQLRYAPQSVDNAFFAHHTPQREEQKKAIRSQLGLEGEFVFLFAGKLEPLKQPTELATAFSRLPEQILDECHLVFVGSGVLEESLKSTFMEHKHIHFVGFQNQSQMPLWYQLADVLCLVSTTETWGLAINEAMASGTGILASNQVGCHPDLLQDNPTGAIVKSDNPDEWPAAMAELFETMRSAESATSASKHIIASHDVTITAAAILQHLHHEAA